MKSSLFFIIRLKKRLLGVPESFLKSIALNGLSLFLFFIIGLHSSFLHSQYGDIPSDRIPPNGWQNVQWNDPGGWTTINMNANGLPPNSSSTDAAQKVRDVISSTSGNRILYFPTGTYYFNTDLEITTDNVRLTGDGITETELILNAPSSSNAEIAFVGGGLGTEVDVTDTPSRGDQQLNIASTSGLSVGDFISVYNKDGGIEFGTYLKSQIVRIDAISGNTLTTDMKFGIPFNSNPKIKKIDMIRNVGIEDLKVSRVRAASSANIQNINFRNAFNGYAKNLESAFSERAHVSASSSRDIVVENISAHEAFNYGGGGQGYGIVFVSGSTRCRATNNKLWSLRHHIMVILGANHCVVSYNSTETPLIGTDADLNFHGFYPHNNLYEGNKGRNLIMDRRSEDGDDSQGDYNFWFRNDVNNKIQILQPTFGTIASFPTIVGNIGSILSIDSDVQNEYIAANRIDGNILWGELASDASIPNSVYLSAKPSFLGSKPWPIFGPGVASGWGTDNTLPATDRSRIPEPPSPPSSGIGPLADAFVRGGSFSGSNYGASGSLLVKDSNNNDNDRESYLRFNVSGINATSAELRLFIASMEGSSGSNRPLELYRVSDDSWSESGITWSNRPSRGTLISSFNVTDSDIGTTIGIDVTAYVIEQSGGDGLASFVLIQPSTANANVVFNSREGTNPPTLEVSESSNVSIHSFSDEQSPNSASNIIDGNTGDNFRWSASGFPQWVIIDYGSNKNITGTRLWAYQDRAYKFKVEMSTSLDFSNSLVVNRLNNTSSVQPIPNDFSSVTARYVKLTVTGASGYTGTWSSINEFEIVESGGTALKVNLSHFEIEMVDNGTLLYPMPAKDFLNIVLLNTGTIDNNEPLRLDIFDISGNLIHSDEKMSYDKEAHSALLNVSSLPEGYYILRIESGANVLNKKIIIDR